MAVRSPLCRCKSCTRPSSSLLSRNNNKHGRANGQAAPLREKAEDRSVGARTNDGHRAICAQVLRPYLSAMRARRMKTTHTGPTFLFRKSGASPLVHFGSCPAATSLRKEANPSIFSYQREPSPSGARGVCTLLLPGNSVSCSCVVHGFCISPNFPLLAFLCSDAPASRFGSAPVSVQWAGPAQDNNGTSV